MADEFDAVPSGEAVERERERWAETRDTRQRVREVVAGLRRPTPAAEIADLAACSTNAARKHLADLTDLGVARVDDAGQGARYYRNDEYVRWRRANELAAEYTVDELLDRLAGLEAEDEAFREEFGVPGPDAVGFEDDADHETIHERWEAAGDWATVRRDVGVLKDAIRMAKRRQQEGGGGGEGEGEIPA